MQKDIKQIAENYFGPQNKEYRLRHRLAGTPQEYWTLALFLNGKDAGVFTSKNYSSHNLVFEYALQYPN